MFPSIEPSEVGNTGLLWLFGSYGYVLFRASGLISEGSELLLLVPSLAGLVGGVVLPLLGAVPDGAIMLFSGLGDIETAQETLSVGVGALAGSTIMLLTIPLGLSVLAGRVDLVPAQAGSEDLVANYTGKPKLSLSAPLTYSGVTVTNEIKQGAYVMMLTTIPYFLIQIPCSYLEGTHSDSIASGEKMWALLALFFCISGFVWYLLIHVKASREEEQKFRRMEAMKKTLKSGDLSLGGVFYNMIEEEKAKEAIPSDGYGSINVDASEPSPKIIEYLKSILAIPFQKYDMDGDQTLSKTEVNVFLKDFNENVSPEDLDKMFKTFDTDGNGEMTVDEFVLMCYHILMSQHGQKSSSDRSTRHLEKNFAEAAMSTVDDEEEEEEIPEDIAHLSPDEQEAAVKKKAFTMLAFGTFLVLLFSDPMVDVMQEIAERMDISPFYVSFILAPLASNASEVLSSTYYASKKTTKTISVAFSALEGAAAMNNTFCLAIFMGLIFFRGLAWQYTAETIAIVAVQGIIYYMTQKNYLTALDGLIVIAVFPLSVAFIAILTAIGFD